MTRIFAASSCVAIACASCSGSKTESAKPIAPIVSAAPSASAIAKPEDDATARETKLIAKMLRRVAAARKLAPKHPVPGKVIDRADLIAKIKAHVGREVPLDAIEYEKIALQLCGFIPPKFDYLAETMSLLDAQLAGFYEPADGTMYMAADLDEDNAKATLAHELVHALQDQYFDLAPRSKYVEGESDKLGAASALAEGDATSAMADVLIQEHAKTKTALDIPDDVFEEQVLASVSEGRAAQEPHIMRTSLVAPYINGLHFVNTLRREGGWSRVDEAWANPPITSEQFLHVEKWEAHEAPLDVHVPDEGPPNDVPITGEGAWRAVDHDSEGEIGLRLGYEEWIGKEAAEEVASHWGGDAMTLFASGDRYAMAMHIRYDHDAANKGVRAQKAWAAIAAGLEKKWGRAATKTTGPNAMVCFERADLGPLVMARRGEDLAFTFGPAHATADGMTSASTCAIAKTWAAKVIAAK